MQVSLEYPDGDAGAFLGRVQRHLNAHVFPIKVRLHQPVGLLWTVPITVDEVLRSEAITWACEQPHGGDPGGTEELRALILEGAAELRGAPRRAGASTLIPAEAWEVGERLRWMVTNPEPFCSGVKTPATAGEADRLVGAFIGWFLGEVSEGDPKGIPGGWRMARLEPRAYLGFYDGFYDTALVFWRGVELRILFQTGSD